MFWCAFVACCLTVHLIMKHCTNFSNSRQQRCICRILLMVPVYAGDSWLSLRFFRQSVFFDTGKQPPSQPLPPSLQHHTARIITSFSFTSSAPIAVIITFTISQLHAVRDCYEAVVIYTFFQLLVLYIGGEGEVSALFRSKRVKLLFPLNCFEVHSDKLCVTPFSTSMLVQGFIFCSGLGFRAVQRPCLFRYTWCKRGCLQYVIIRPITTFAAVLAQITNVLCPGNLDPRFGFVWINMINLASVTVAMYTLVLVYVITSDKLQPFSPIPKFWAIKSIIFLSFWQLVIVVALQKAGALDRFETQCVTCFIHFVFVTSCTGTSPPTTSPTAFRTFASASKCCSARLLTCMPSPTSPTSLPPTRAPWRRLPSPSAAAAFLSPCPVSCSSSTLSTCGRTSSRLSSSSLRRSSMPASVLRHVTRHTS
jgi:hypothetical protein